MTQDQTTDRNEVEKRYDTDRHRVKVGVPLVRRPAPATRAAEVGDVYDEDVAERSDRAGLNGRELR
jgi:hypothetical protein